MKMTQLENKKFSLFWVIVDLGKGEKVFREAKKLGATGGTFFLGKGTIKSHFLNLLGFDEAKKEILVMAIDEKLEEVFHQELDRKFSFHKLNHGITFSMPIKRIVGIKGLDYEPNLKSRGGEEMGFEAIITIVDRGLSEDVIEAAKSAGATGATVIHGRGSGTHEKAKLFNIEIEPEKEIVLILAESTIADAIVEAIKERVNIDKPGVGILFVLDVKQAVGLAQLK
jgi:nitrogen regulatory protein PII